MNTINEKIIITYEKYDLTIKNNSLDVDETKPVITNFVNNWFGFIRSFFINNKKETIQEVLDNKHFKNWLTKCNESKINISKINIDTVIRFGSRIGFICASSNANVDIFNKKENEFENKKIPGTIFIRGNSVCCLLIIKVVEENKYHHHD